MGVRHVGTAADSAEDIVTDGALTERLTAATNTVLGNNTGSSAPVINLTMAELRAILSLSLTDISDVPATNPIATQSFWVGTQSAYDALTPDANTIYFIENT